MLQLNVFWWLTQWALDLTKQLQSFNIIFLNLNWAVVINKMYISLLKYKKEANIYISKR